jgi:ubiquinone/menaquinone biosynthesis C-methylase UbiE
MVTALMQRSNEMSALASFLDILRCPGSSEPLRITGDGLVSADGRHHYRLSEAAIPLFAESLASPEAVTQRRHYNKIAAAYTANLEYPHTQEYLDYLDRVTRDAIGGHNLGTMVELCCGRGEALHLFGAQAQRYIGIDVSENMLQAALKHNRHPHSIFLQGDATQVPLASGCADTVVMLGGIHHVPARAQLFSEVARILKPGGRFLYREPVSDFALWRWLRAIIYRLSPMLDEQTERPLLFKETVPVMEKAGLRSLQYRSHGLVGFCLFMNSDVLFVNRLFRFVPGIRSVTRASARFDEAVLQLPGLARCGLQVVGVAEKPAD